MTTYMLQPIAGSFEELEIPVVYSLDFANNLVASVGDAFERAYKETQVYWEEEIVVGGAGMMRRKIPLRLCKNCEKPILVGRAWVFYFDDRPNHKVYRYTDAAKKYGLLTGPCCEMGILYNEIRDNWIRKQLDKILVSLRTYTGGGAVSVKKKHEKF